MKQIKANRFTNKRPEKISFQGGAILENPKAEKQSEVAEEKQKRKNDRTNVRTDIRTNVRPYAQKETWESSRYQIEIPQIRRKVRHSFDIFKDQKSALEKLQLATADEEGSKPSMGEMVQDSIDLYTSQKAKKLSNVDLIFHNTKMFVRPNERSNK